MGGGSGQGGVGHLDAIKAKKRLDILVVGLLLTALVISLTAGFMLSKPHTGVWYGEWLGYALMSLLICVILIGLWFAVRPGGKP